MHVLSSPIRYMQLRRTHKKQKRNALYMLAVSGVIRPSSIELRYSTSIASMTTFRRQAAVNEHQQTHPLPLPSWDHNLKQTRQWTRNFSSSLVQLAKKPIVFPWTKQLDL